MHQAKRGLAHVMLHEGTDISDRISEMYDISGWSLSLLWGADVADVQTAEVVAASAPSPRPAPSAACRRERRRLRAAAHHRGRARRPGPALGGDVSLQRAPDGTVLIPAAERPRLVRLAGELDVAFTRLTSLPGDRQRLPAPKIASALGTTVLGESSTILLDEVLGLDVTKVNAVQVREGTVDLRGFDVLLTAENQITWSSLQAAGQQKVREFLAGGGGLVTYGRATALNLVEASGLVRGSRPRAAAPTPTASSRSSTRTPRCCRPRPVRPTRSATRSRGSTSSARRRRCRRWPPTRWSAGTGWPAPATTSSARRRRQVRR
jgi:hypothetical protein